MHRHGDCPPPIGGVRSRGWAAVRELLEAEGTPIAIGRDTSASGLRSGSLAVLRARGTRAGADLSSRKAAAREAGRPKKTRGGTRAD